MSRNSVEPLPPALCVTVPAASATYPIYIQAGASENLPALLARHLPGAGKLLLVSDTLVAPLYAQPVVQALASAGYQVHQAIVPTGEEAKTLAHLETLYEAAHAFGLSRRDAVVALGGGVVGDLAGYCAASYLRGTRFVQLPTTLLAQVDSSVGGKVAVNFRTTKNALGAFYQPDLVVMDTQWLATLPERELKAGLAEVVKYGLIENTCDPQAAPRAFFEQLVRQADCLRPGTPELAAVIRRCCELKAMVVAADETESTGVRSYLNLGHTFAHAYEEITAYRQWRHGEAVAFGLVQACRLSEALDIFPPTETQELRRLFDRLGLPQAPELDFPAEELVALMRHDKKAHAGRIRFVLPEDRIGRVVLRDDVPEATVCTVLQSNYG